MLINDKNHLYHLIKYGVYFGYSNDSIIEFIQNFGTAYEEINGKFFDYRIKCETAGTGHMCSWYEAITLSYKELTNLINSNRYCDIIFPWDNDKPFNKTLTDSYVTNLYSTNFMYRYKVEQLFNYITTNFDITFQQE